MQALPPGYEGDSIGYYIDQVVADLNRLLSTTPAPQPGPAMKAWRIAGSERPLLLPADVQFKVALVAPGQTNQRPGLPLNPTRFTQHDTGNPNPGMDAAAHSTFLDNGAPDNNGRSQQLSFHFTSDDHEIIQKIPVNEVAWHAGDGGNGPGNRTSLSSELCVNSDRDKAKAERVAAALAAGALNLIEEPLEAMVTHASWVVNVPDGHHSCPASLLTPTNRWPWFQQQVGGWMTGGQVTPAQPRFPNPANVSDDLMQRWFAWADPNGPITQWWLAERVAHGKMPDLAFSDQGKTYVFSDGTTVVYANGQVTEVTA